MLGKMKGWNFLGKKLSADGSTTNENLRTEKKRLEARLVEIPVIIARLRNGIASQEGDITWLNGLNNRRRKNWEKEKGKDLKQTVYDLTNAVANSKAQISSLDTEMGRIPAQIEAIDRQLDAMVKGESTGLSKGLTTAQAKQLGELELQKEQEQIQHEQQIQAVELQKAQTEAQNAAKPKTGMSPELKWGLIIGSVILTALVAYLIYKRRKANALLPTPIKL
ncbi:MAG: hypothetical protein A3D31_11340 [Candidatus Fluviicola riflensis]|nr:MAG: hypothetical protein CHH17_15765 [Candidatus Fluviicola riflensis]OGS77583.1 MAG: hypothetical protein A3D31_11340 [Candidatus Fluviicola riflensis]OGS84165.1 MAG: hypothetical protein A3E30_12745 [Fluviicola sp. RIFCSPHIGHO2_12_FULL_43_24]OGS84649.1 MAG: hypothetical protein A2724_08275 [Fluviicola sp. RIFCSPHIGHO2_01_FULL_43_53]